MVNPAYVDTPSTPRLGDDLDNARLSLWLKNNVPGMDEAEQVQQFKSGLSQLNYLVVGNNRQVVLRRTPTGSRVLSSHDVGREYRTLLKLYEHYPLCPKPMASCDDPGLLGSNFFAMERLHGVILHRELPDGFNLTEKQATKLCEQVVDAQAKLHKIDVERTGLLSLGTANGYIERQINSWINRFSRARTNDVADCEDIMEWLQEHLPEQDEDSPVALLHNDFKLNNLVLDAKNHSKVIGVIDWENSAIGHPLMDVGISLANWITPDDPEDVQAYRSGPTHIPGMMSREDYIARYAKKTGFDVKDISYFHVYGLFRCIGELQQVYYRHVKGMTRNPIFADYGTWINALADYADTLLD